MTCKEPGGDLTSGRKVNLCGDSRRSTKLNTAFTRDRVSVACEGLGALKAR